MKSTTLAFRAAMSALVLLFLFVATTGRAQIRQTHLYIDDGNGAFTILSAPVGGGSITFPSSGTLLSSSSGLSLTPSTTQTIVAQANISPLIIEGASGQTFYLQQWENNTPSFLMGVTASGALNQTTAAQGSSATTGIQFNSHTYFWGNDNTGSVFVGQGSGAATTVSETLQRDAALGSFTLNHENSGSGENVAIGYQALQTETGSTGEVAIGLGAMGGLSSGDFNIAIGFNSMGNNSHGGTGNVAVGPNTISLGTGGANNSTTAIGYQALEHVDGTSNNTAVGYNALNGNSAGNNNTAMGYSAAAITTASNNTAIGYDAMVNSTSSTNDVAVGYNAMGGFAGQPNTGNDNTAIGYNSLGVERTTGADNTGLGYNSLQTVTAGTENTALGSGADVSSAFATNRTAIGYNASAAADNNIQLGNPSILTVTTAGTLTSGLTNTHAGSLVINDGTAAGNAATLNNVNGSTATFSFPATGSGTLVVSGTDVVLAPTAVQTVQPSSGHDIVPLAIEAESGQTHDLQEWQNSSAQNLIKITAAGALDFQNGMTSTTGIRNNGTTVFWNLAHDVFAGPGAGGTAYTGGFYNTGFGFNALNSLPNVGPGGDNDAFGREALLDDQSGGSNAAFGDDALELNVNGSNNTAVGGIALLATTGSNNTAVGYEAGYTSNSSFKNTSGQNNTYVGYQAGPGGATQHNNSTAIGTFAAVDEDDALVLGEIATVNGASNTVKVGIGTIQPAALLSVGTSSALQVDASGNLSTSGTVATTASPATTLASLSVTNGATADATALGAKINEIAANTGNTDVGLQFNVTGGAANYDIYGSGTAPGNWNVTSLGSGSFSSALLNGASLVTNAALSIKGTGTSGGHIQSQQTTAPLAAAGANNPTNDAITPGSASVTHATDIAGALSIQENATGNGGTAPASGSQAVVTFNKTYTTAPIVVITPTDAPTAAAMSADQFYVTSLAGSFTINAGVAPTQGTVYNFNYHVIETQ
jgi:trimeric autotransporter adhesin